MTDLSDLIVFWAVVAVRFFVPFAIPKFPLPAVLAALVADGIDQTIYQQYTELPLDKYQGYDKALDVYYQTIAYLSTLRSWTNRSAFRISRFLFYYRIIGVSLFELTGFRALLIIFPNTFEYFFIFYETVRLKWNPKRYGIAFLIASTAVIWVVIKLPQEFILHIIQVDTTEWIGENVFSGDSASTFIYMPGTAIISILLIVATVWLTRRIPPADWKASVSVDTHLAPLPAVNEDGGPPSPSRRLQFMELVEKITVVALVGIIFAKSLPDVRATGGEIAIGGTILLLISTAVSQWLSSRGTSWIATYVEFVAMLAVNLFLILLISFLLPSYDGSFNFINVVFFTLLFTVVITMFDRYKQIYRQRFAISQTGTEAQHVSG
ncbi:MAG: hypothetical protein QF898_02460 [SAR202 cluster bacterium]|nr:hypothetical protein [SAR202 cluster bacterium]MDP6715864.1 hypothetical protein [SAR202 cluster bacterium]